MNIIRSFHDFNRDEILAVLRSLDYDPKAKPIFELMAGATYWTDELPDQKMGSLQGACSIYLRTCFAYRHSLSLGNANPKYKNDWQKIKTELPNWPGFRDDRIYGWAARFAKVCDRQMQRSFDEAERQMDEEDKDRANQSLHQSP